MLWLVQTSDCAPIPFPLVTLLCNVYVIFSLAFSKCCLHAPGVSFTFLPFSMLDLLELLYNYSFFSLSLAACCIVEFNGGMLSVDFENK